MQFNVADLLERVADTVPDHLALVCAQRRLTFAELDARANRLAHVLAARGVGAGDHVALYLYNSTEYLEGMLAAFKLRAVPINVNYRYVEDELRYLLDDADAVAVVFHREFAPKLAAIRAEPARSCARSSRSTTAATPSSRPRRSTPTTTRTRSRRRRPSATSAPRSADDLYLLYTGGTTGMPKGVMWRHVDLFFGAMAGAGGGGAPIRTPEEIAERCREPRTRCVPICPFMHGTAHWMAFSTLFMGGTVDHPGRAPPRPARAVATRRTRAGELHRHRRRRVRAPAARRARLARRARRSTCRACTSCCRAARSSRRR